MDRIYQCYIRTLSQVPCRTKFLRVLIFAIFAVFFMIRKKRFPRKKILAKILSARIYSIVEIMHKHRLLNFT